MKGILFVGLGGAVGATGRYLISLAPVKTAFPFATLFTNILGAFFIGLIAGISFHRGIKKEWLLFFKTGVCGGFTTFSTFSLESFGLLQDKHYITGSIYIILSIFFCILGTALGQYAASCLFKK